MEALAYYMFWAGVLSTGTATVAGLAYALVPTVAMRSAATNVGTVQVPVLVPAPLWMRDESRAMAWAGAAFLAVYLGFRWKASGLPPASNMWEYTVAFGWNFWATWCPPCREEVPELVAAYERHREHSLVIVGIDLQEPDGQVLAFMEESGMTFPVVIDRDGDVADAWRLGGPIEGIPTSYFVDETGVIRDFFYGPMTEDLLETRLTKILSEDAI